MFAKCIRLVKVCVVRRKRRMGFSRRDVAGAFLCVKERWFVPQKVVRGLFSEREKEENDILDG